MRNNNMILLFNNSFFRKLMLLTLVVGQLFGQNSDSVKIDGPMPTIADSLAADTMVVHKLDRVVKNRAFSVGEKLTFNIRYGIIKAGEATMAVAEQLPINESHEAYRIVSTARSASFFDNFYKVRDSVETFLDTRGLFSWRFEKRLREGGAKVEVLDGDIVRTNLSKGLGFSKEDRDTNIRRIGFVANLLTRNGVPVMTAAISPYKAIREECRALIGPDSFVEVHVHAPLEVLIERDTKGLYKKALAGEIKEFTGVSDPYEEPENPDVKVHTHEESVEESLEKIWAHLKERGFVE